MCFRPDICGSIASREQWVWRRRYFFSYGLFADESGRDRHHRIFGYLHPRSSALGSEPSCQPACLDGFAHEHPHTIGQWNDNNTLYFGAGRTARRTSHHLRLSNPGAVSRWRIPDWLPDVGLSYHSKPHRWSVDGELSIVSRGQEFVTQASPTILRHALGSATLFKKSRANDDGAEGHPGTAAATLPCRYRASRKPFWEFGSFGVHGLPRPRACA